MTWPKYFCCATPFLTSLLALNCGILRQCSPSDFRETGIEINTYLAEQDLSNLH